jgi:negative regulator of flagellin synthesis FlgM
MSSRIDPMTHGLLGKIAERATGSAGAGKVGKGDPAVRGQNQERPAGGDTVELTSSAKLLERLEKTLGSLPEIDRARVDAVKAAIANGEYEVDADRIAAALLYSDLKLGE